MAKSQFAAHLTTGDECFLTVERYDLSGAHNPSHVLNINAAANSGRYDGGQIIIYGTAEQIDAQLTDLITAAIKARVEWGNDHPVADPHDTAASDLELIEAAEKVSA